MKILSLYLIVLLATLANAETNKPSPDISMSSLGSIEVRTIYGEKTSQFSITKTNGPSGVQANLGLSINGILIKRRDLSIKNADYIEREFEKLPVPAQVPSVCYRSRIDILRTTGDGKVQSKSSCFGLPTNTEGAYAKFTQLLVLAL